MPAERELKRPSSADEVEEEFPDPAKDHLHGEGDVANTYAEDYWIDILGRLLQHDDEDRIHECVDVELRKLSEDSKRYLNLADRKLHVFPFKDVQPCWFRLYTDASAIEAVKIVRDSQMARQRDESWLQKVVTMLDMAIITAGALGREELYEEVFTQLESLWGVREPAKHSAKRRKTSDTLPVEEHSIPALSRWLQRELRQPTLPAFEKYMNTVKEPVLLTGILEDWPALERWPSQSYWNQLTLDGRRLVPIETGRSYVDPDWGQQILPFKEFVDRYIVEETDQKGYLAQYDLFHHIPKLNRDVLTPDYCFLDAPAPDPDTPVAKAKMKGGLKSAGPVSDDVQKNIWFGPAWTISPLHHDPYHNILCQVVGKKYIRLYAPQHSAGLYPRAEDEPAPHGDGTIDMSNTSRVDISSIELSAHEDWDEEWPGFSQVPYQEIILEAGQALYIPVGWWHYVRSCSVGISVSFWW